MSMPAVTIIGLGALGTALAEAFGEENISIKSIFNRHSERAQTIASQWSVSIFSDFPSGRQELAPIVFITVSDTAISEIVQQIMGWEVDLSGIIFVHCSGNESAAILEPLRQQGAQIASMHPLQTFTSKSGSTDFKGIYFSLQGDQEAFSMLEAIANRLGGRTLEVSARQKAHLHAAAVFVSNYLVTLLEDSTETAAASGLSDQQVKEALLPLAQTTLKNTRSQAFSEALSGPIKRGDSKTIKDHVALLKDRPELRALYCSLGKKTVASARSSGYIDEETAAMFVEILR